MYEFTHKGAWFRWTALDRTSKTLFVGSMTTAVASILLLRQSFKRMGAELHDRVHDHGSGAIAVQDISAPAALFAIGLGALSAWLWWRFSLRQDEMFNRVQNWTIGMTGGWLAAALLVWGILARADLMPPLWGLHVLVLASLLYIIFWFAAVRRWGASD